MLDRYKLALSRGYMLHTHRLWQSKEMLDSYKLALSRGYILHTHRLWQSKISTLFAPYTGCSGNPLCQRGVAQPKSGGKTYMLCTCINNDNQRPAPFVKKADSWHAQSLYADHSLCIDIYFICDNKRGRNTGLFQLKKMFLFCFTISTRFNAYSL